VWSARHPRAFVLVGPPHVAPGSASIPSSRRISVNSCLFVVCLCVFLTTSCATTAREPQVQSNVGVTLENFKLNGDLSGERRAAFNLTATVKVDTSKGGTLELLSGTVALTDIGPHPDYRIRIETNRFVLIFDRKGKFPVRIAFDAAVKQTETWKSVDFS